MAEKPGFPRRFYATVSIAPAEGGYAVLLDGRSVRSPARNSLVLPTNALADAIAAEWRRQGEFIDPTRMPLTRLANSALDGVAERAGEVVDDIAAYAGSDLVVYRAGAPERLVAAQAAAWDPVLAYAREDLGARFILGEGVMPVVQPPGTAERVRAAVAATPSPFGLAALHVLTTLTGSVLIALMLRDRRIDPAAAWQAAHVDELFQESMWGQDGEAAERRARREEELLAAHTTLALI